MAGKPFQVGRFAYTLRVRLMQEHLGVDVDELPVGDLPSNSHGGREGRVGSNGDNNLAPGEARVHHGSGQAHGAPENARPSPRTNDLLPSSDPPVQDADHEVEQPIPVVRDRLSVDVESAFWTTPPVIVPHKFDDPVSDSFYEDVWLAAASQNVRVTDPRFKVYMSADVRSVFRPRFSARCSA